MEKLLYIAGILLIIMIIPVVYEMWQPFICDISGNHWDYLFDECVEHILRAYPSN